MSIGDLFNTILYEPIINLLFWLVHVLPGGDFGVAIILTTIIVRLLLFIPSMHQIKSQKAMQEIQPKIEEIRKKYANNREEMGRQLMAFYRENKVNPLSSCLPLLVQFPILIALYRVFISGLVTDPATGTLIAAQLEHLYGPLRAVFETKTIDATLFGFVDLTTQKNIIMAVLAAGLQFLQARMITVRKKDAPKPATGQGGMAQGLNRQMMYLFPAITFIFAYQFPAGLGLYWVVSTAFSILQQLFLFRKKKNAPADGNAS